MEILAQAENPPRAVLFKSDAKIVADHLAVLRLEFVSGNTVDRVDAEVMAPVVAPFRLVKALHYKDQFLDVLRNRFQPGIVLRRVFSLGRSQQLDDRTERAFMAEDFAAVLAPEGLFFETLRVIAMDQFGNA